MQYICRRSRNVDQGFEVVTSQVTTIWLENSGEVVVLQENMPKSGELRQK